MSQAMPVTKVGVYHPMQGRRGEGHQLVGAFAPDPGVAVRCSASWSKRRARSWNASPADWPPPRCVGRS